MASGSLRIPELGGSSRTRGQALLRQAVRRQWQECAPALVRSPPVAGANPCQKSGRICCVFRSGIPTARLAAYGIENRYGGFRRGALITEEIRDTADLATLALQQDVRLRNSHWVGLVSAQIAYAHASDA